MNTQDDDIPSMVVVPFSQTIALVLLFVALLNSEHALTLLMLTVLGLTIGSTMTGESFIRMESLLILGMGLLAFVIDTAGGLLLGKLMYLLSRRNFNPLIGAAGISAFPMSARIVQRMGQEFDFENFLLMHAMGANTAGQLGSVVAGGVVLTLLAGAV